MNPLLKGGCGSTVESLVFRYRVYSKQIHVSGLIQGKNLQKYEGPIILSQCAHLSKKPGNLNM